MVAAAAIGGAVVGGVATAYSGKKAANAAESGAEQSAAVQQYMYDTSRKDLAPWRNVGVSALGKLANLYGLSTNGAGAGSAAPDYSEGNFDPVAYLKANPDVAAEYMDPWYHYQAAGKYEGRAFPFINAPTAAQPAAANDGQGKPDYSDFYNSPDYQFTFNEGQRAVNSGLAARGLSNSGRALKELTRYGQGAASTQLNNYRNALASLAGIGQTTATQTSQLGQSYATNVGNAYQNAADARASGYLSTGNAVSGGINNAFGTYALMNLMK